MKNNITEVVFILDRSGSMAGFEKDTVGGFNAALEKQKKTEGTVYISTYLFSSGSELVHDRIPLDEVRPMTEDDYEVGGCTALMDTVGEAVRHIESIHRYLRPEDVPEHTLFIITTDGMENASRRYSREQIRRIIEEKQKEQGWEFLFLAANIDAEETAESFGIPKERAKKFTQDPYGYKATFSCMSSAISSLRNGKNLEDGSWKKSEE